MSLINSPDGGAIPQSQPATDPIVSQVLGLPPPPPNSSTAQPTVASGAPTVSTTPSAGQGIALDLNGKLPASVAFKSSGYEFAYAEITANANITATTEATANTVITAPSADVDGSTVVIIEFYSAVVRAGTGSIAIWLFDGSTSIGLIGFANVAGKQAPMTLKRRFTPANGAHTYSIRASVDAGTGLVGADVGGAGLTMPAYLRVTRA